MLGLICMHRPEGRHIKQVRYRVIMYVGYYIGMYTVYISVQHLL